MADKDLKGKGKAIEEEKVEAGNGGVDAFKSCPDAVGFVADRLNLVDFRSFAQSNAYFRRVLRGGCNAGCLLNKVGSSFLLVSKGYSTLGSTNIFCLRDITGNLLPVVRNFELPELSESSIVGVLDSRLCLVDESRWMFGIYNFVSGSLVKHPFPTPRAPIGLANIAVGFGKVDDDYQIFLHMYAFEKSAFLFSLRDSAWKSIPVCPFGDASSADSYKCYWKEESLTCLGKHYHEVPLTAGVFYKGFLYWRGFCDPFHLMRFNIANRTYSLVAVPLPGFRFIRLGVIFGQLAVCHCHVSTPNYASIHLFDGSEFQRIRLKFPHSTFGTATTLKPLFFTEKGTLVLLQDDRQLIGINIFSGLEESYSVAGMGGADRQYYGVLPADWLISGFHCSGNYFSTGPSIPSGTTLPSSHNAVAQPSSHNVVAQPSHNAVALPLPRQPSALGAFTLLRQPSALGLFTFLRKLNIGNNNLTSLPMDIGLLTWLEIFKVKSNRLTSLPAGLGALISLRVLNVAKNKLTCLPDEIGLLARLDVLKVNSNRLTFLPSGLGALTSLRHLNVTKNNLTCLPDEVVRLTQLQVLKVKSNRLTSLPAGMGALASPSKLDIANNKLKSFSTQLEVLIADNLG